MRRIWLALLILVAAPFTAPSPMAAEPEAHGLGCRLPNAKQREWERRNMVIVRRVRPNKLGLERMNAHRQQKGLPPLTASDAGLMPNGQDIEGAPAAAAPAALMAAPAAGGPGAGGLPTYVNNSQLKFFPPIGNQGVQGSCAQWAGMYYAYTYMTAMARDWDAKTGGSTLRFAPGFTYNMVNGGTDNGSWYTEGWAIAQRHGCATLNDMPYNAVDYLSWPTTAAVWRNAINYRADSYGYVTNLDTNAGLTNLKQMLTNGYVLCYATNINQWRYKAIGNDPGTNADDAFVGLAACYYMQTAAVSPDHAMTVVGYNDDIWIDINANGNVDAGEKGALLIANSWGAGWGNAGYMWVAYDALLDSTAVAGWGGGAPRMPVFWSHEAAWVTSRSAYTPKMAAEFSINTANREQLWIWLGRSNTATTTPTTTWLPYYVFDNAGGANAFNGSVVLDFSDLAISGAAYRYYLGVNDNTAGTAATVNSYTLKDVTNSVDTACGALPQAVDNQTKYFYADRTYAAGHEPPEAIAEVDPSAVGSAGDTLHFHCSTSHAHDGYNLAAWKWEIDGVQVSVLDEFDYTFAADGVYSVRLTVTDDATPALSGSDTIIVHIGNHTQPDLVITSISCSPSSPHPGKTATFTVNVRNQGLASASGTINIGFWSNLAGAPTIATAPDANANITGGIAAGQTKSVTFSVTPASLGSYKAWAYVDRAGGVSAVDESDETNNAGPSGGFAWTATLSSGGGGGGGGGCSLGYAPAPLCGAISWAAPYLVLIGAWGLGRLLSRRRTA